MTLPENSSVWHRIRELLASQRFAVLATSGDNQAYGSLVAFAETADCKRMLFVTGRGTRKYANLRGNEQVALVVDNRSNSRADLTAALAITATGVAREVTSEELESMAGVYLGKHPYLTEFIALSSNALIKVDIRSYVVAGFDQTVVIRL